MRTQLMSFALLMGKRYPCTGKFRLVTRETKYFPPSVGRRLSDSKADTEENITEEEKGQISDKAFGSLKPAMSEVTIAPILSSHIPGYWVQTNTCPHPHTPFFIRPILSLVSVLPTD